MSEFFLTDPDNLSDEEIEKRKPTNISFDYKERIREHLREAGVPLRVADCATIDLKYLINECFAYKLTPFQTARMMISEVERIYMTDDKWHYE